MSALAEATAACRGTASKAGLLAECRWWARHEAEWSDTAGAAAERGTRFHSAIALYVSVLPGVPLKVDDDIAAEYDAARAWVDAFGRERLEAEVAFAWDPVTGEAERIGTNLGRDYSRGKGRFCGSADLISVSRATKVGYVGDWSTGDGSRKGPQLRALALMLSRVEGLESVTVEALEVDATGVRHVCTETLDAFALAAVAGELAEALAAVPAAEPRPGPHCGDMYCPARATCPAIRERIADIIPVETLTQHRWGLTIASPDHAAWLYNQAKAVEAAAKLVKEVVKAFVPADGLTLSDGSVFKESTRMITRFSQDRAVALLRALGATDEQIESCTPPAHKESNGLRVTGGAAKAKKRKAA